MRKVIFAGYTCELKFAKYSNNNRTALILIDSLSKEDVAVATVNIPGAHLNDSEVVIKDYSENSGMLLALIRAGIVAVPSRHISTGFVQCPVCELLVSD